MSSFVLTLELDTEKWQSDILDKRFNIGRQIYNACLGEILKRHNTMCERKEYQHVVKIPKSTERNKKFRELNLKYGLTEYSLHAYVKSQQHNFAKNIDSATAQKIATMAYNAFKKYMFHEAKRVQFKKHNELNSLESKQANAGIRFVSNSLRWNGLKISAIIKKNDDYANEALENKIKYCRVIRKFIRNKYKYYIQIILDGVPPEKINAKTSNTKHKRGKKKVGLDIGTQTIAISSSNTVKLLELAPNIENTEKEKRLLLRKLDRQRRMSNPNNYSVDGTIKKQGNKKVLWVYSKKYIKTKNKLKDIYRKQADIRKQDHEKLANYIISLGNEIYVEDMNFRALQKRAKETTINSKTGKFNKKKRFGKSLANKAPSMLLTILDNKLKYNNNELYKVNTRKVRVSQYNHIPDTYIKKELKDRWNNLDGLKIQRDLYSAFLLMNIKGNLKEVDRDLCFRTFDGFIKLHDEEINRIRNIDNKSNSIKNVM